MGVTEPFLRWAGGKRWLAKTLAPILARRLGEQGTYREPFLGSGAMFFGVHPARAVLSDLNEELIVTFRMVAERHSALREELAKLPSTSEEYERIRSWRPDTDFDRAVRFIYLNRNCYGGLYRENRKGHFNVPYGGGGRTHKGVCSTGVLSRTSIALNRDQVELHVCDFGANLRDATSGDVVYCDPTYREVTRKQFDRYGRIVFGWEDQERLAKLSFAAYSAGALVLLSNASCAELRSLYSSAGVIEVRRRKGLGVVGPGQSWSEYLFILDPLSDWSSWRQIGTLQMPEQALTAHALDAPQERLGTPREGRHIV